MSVIGFLGVAASEVVVEASGVVVEATEVGSLSLLVTGSEVGVEGKMIHIGKVVVLLDILI